MVMLVSLMTRNHRLDYLQSQVKIKSLIVILDSKKKAIFQSSVSRTRRSPKKKRLYLMHVTNQRKMKLMN